MAYILIAYNNDTSAKLHEFMESCGDSVMQYCYDKQIAYTQMTPPDLTEHEMMSQIKEHHICFIAGHGDDDGIYNENDTDVISTRTTNYNFQGKALYCVSCCSAVNLCPSLMQIGLKLYVGYNDTFEVKGDYSPFLQSALSGLKCLLDGDDAKTAKEKMNQIYDEQIDILNQENPWAAVCLLHNKESLVFQGDENYSILRADSITTQKANEGLNTTTQKKESTTQKPLNATQKRILDYLKNYPKATRQEVAIALGDITEDGVKFNIGLLQQYGVLQRKGGRNEGEWVVLIDLNLQQKMKEIYELE